MFLNNSEEQPGAPSTTQLHNTRSYEKRVEIEEEITKGKRDEEGEEMCANGGERKRVRGRDGGENRWRGAPKVIMHVLVF